MEWPRGLKALYSIARDGAPGRDGPEDSALKVRHRIEGLRTFSPRVVSWVWRPMAAPWALNRSPLAGAWVQAFRISRAK